jgi:nucleotide-binding universal stress UspA family protein
MKEVFMYQSILVPLDGSTRAEKILPHLEQLAQGLKARVIFLQVVEPGSQLTAEAIVAEMRQKEKEAEAYFGGLIDAYRAKNIEAEKIIERGPVVDTIIRVAARQRVDLIAMASHGRGGVSRVFYGSVAAGVLQRVDRPLLLVRSREEG